jgi:hypothetical protein
MTIKSLVVAVAAGLFASGCATYEPTPVANAKDCFYPACTLNVEVVDDGAGGKKLKVEGDGNVRMGTRHRLVAIVWNLKTPGYEFRGDSISPHTRSTPGKPASPLGVWTEQILQHKYYDESISVTNQNTERAILYYDLTVYPSTGTPGQPLTLDPAIVNDHCPMPGVWCR